jgi:hypothetical protein
MSIVMIGANRPIVNMIEHKRRGKPAVPLTDTPA